VAAISSASPSRVTNRPLSVRSNRDAEVHPVGCRAALRKLLDPFVVLRFSVTVNPTALLAAFLLPIMVAVGAELPGEGLILDLDAAKGLSLEDGDKVAAWRNQVAASSARDFVKRDEGRKESGSGRPVWRKEVPELKGKPSLVFFQQELVCFDDDSFDGLTTGKGHTWIAVLAVHDQRVGLKDVNSFFGNLRNGDKFEGVWGCLNDDNTLWWGTRNGLTFGRFDTNNPQLLGPMLEGGKFYLVAGRMGAGEGKVKLELFTNSTKPVTTADFPVNPKANPSRMVVGQERDAIQHPGEESFDGEIARFLIWERPLSDAQLALAMVHLRATYFKAP